MKIKDKLQIILITYNRSEHVRHTLEQFFNDKSPVKNCDFLVLDNNSTDDTSKVVAGFSKDYPNIKYSKNPHNVGLSGNIAKAIEIATKDYVWVIGDDDKYDFSNWTEVEKAIEQDEKVICLARYALPDEYKNDIAYQLLQVTFISGLMLNTSLLTDAVIRNVVDNIYTLFPHMPPVLKHINDGGKIYVVNKAISDNGMDIKTTDVSYIRGTKATELYTRTATMSWIVGYCNVCSFLKDEKLKHRAINRGIRYQGIHNGDKNFYKSMKNWYSYTPNTLMQLIDVYMNVDKEHRKHLLPFIKENLLGKSILKRLRELFFKIEKNKEYKTIRILFFEFKRKRHAHKK